MAKGAYYMLWKCICRFNLHLHWTTTIFILNLALADFLYCAVNLPLYALQYLHQRWIWGHTLCYITTAFRYINAFADWMSVSMIAVSRCISLSKPALGERLFAGKVTKMWYQKPLIDVKTNIIDQNRTNYRLNQISTLDIRQKYIF